MLLLLAGVKTSVERRCGRSVSVSVVIASTTVGWANPRTSCFFPGDVPDAVNLSSAMNDTADG